MREGRQLVRDTSAFAREHRGRSWWCFGSTLLLWSGLIALACLDVHWTLRLGASLLAALVNVRLFVIFHDQRHGAILANSRIADLAMRFYGLLALSPASMWDHSHGHHHRNNARRLGLDSVGTYPILSVDEYREARRGARFFYALARHPLTILFGYLTVFLYGFCIVPLVRAPRRHLDSAAALLLHVALVAALALTRPDILLYAVLLPVFVSSAIGSYLFYAQHNFPDARFRPDPGWDYVFAALRSSSYTPMPRLLAWLTANIGYHHVHHLNARIPFYRLPETMAAFEELQSPGTTTLHPRDVIRCLRLKLWDPRSDRLVGWAEARADRSSAA